MFKKLVPPPPTTSTAYIDLKQKVEAYTYTPPRRPPCARDVLARVLAIERRILISLERRERHLPFAGEPQVDRDIEFQERCVAEALEEIRFLLRRSLCFRVRRLVACVLIQKTVLRLLYRPATRPGQLPKISRSLLDDGLVGVGEFGSTVDNGDADDDG